MPSYDEKFKGQMDRYDPKPDSVRTPKMVGSETQDMDMQITAPISNALDNNKSFMGRAVAHLNREVERGAHAPMVGGHQHDHKMR